MNSGIYTIINLIDGKIYIGFSSRLNNRKRMHFNKLKNNKHFNTYLQNAVNKYGIENFKLNVHDRKYGYNIQLTNPDGKLKHSEETKLKIKIFHKNLKHKNKPIVVVDKNNTIIISFSSAKDCANFYNKSISCIYRYIRDKKIINTIDNKIIKSFYINNEPIKKLLNYKMILIKN